MGTMLMLEVVFDGSIEWAIRADDPSCFGLSSLPGHSLLNPALYPRIAEIGVMGGLSAKATFIDHGDFYFVSNAFVLVIDEDASTFQSTAESAIHWEGRLSALTSHLRFASKQAPLKARLKSFGPRCLCCLPPLELPEEGEGCVTASWHLRTAIRKEHILYAGQQSLDASPPSYTTLLLDAIDSLANGEYVNAFLLGAISMDHLSRVKATEALASAFGAGSDRCLALDFPASTTPESRTERTDELFNLLLRERRFKQLLHSVPLALTGRSLLRDNKGLYDKVLRIYETRNRVVHKDLGFKQEFLPRFFGWDEAIETVRCAIQLAGWFGEEGNYAHPFDGAQGAMCVLAKS